MPMEPARAPAQCGRMWLLYSILTVLLLPTALVIAIHMSRIRFARTLVAKTEPAQSCPEGYRSVIVVAGDSTAFGVGALPAESTAGRLAAAFPHARVVNVAKSGNRIGHVVEQLDKVDCKSADLILIQACANDVLEFRSVRKVEADLRAAIARARKLSRNIVLMPGHDFSVAPFFLRPISMLIMRHAVKVHAMVKRVVAEEGIIFVDLFRDPATEPFVKEPTRYYCPDFLHPSGQGYAIWFSILTAQVPLRQFLATNGSD
ncbi:MAG TPA: SGNH/GDSL hydrolase family protein [Usitatibacter sp.]|nr:SGNH/GDSL hydrolase family protein [Usitatibacter sp.]